MSRSLTHSSLPHSLGQVRTLFGGESPLAMVATEGDEHAIRFVNPAFCRLLGQNAVLMVGRPLAALLGAGSSLGHEDSLALLDLVYTTGRAEFAVDLARVVGDTHASALRCAVWPILDDDGRPCGLLLQVNAPRDDPPIGLRDVNERLLVAGLEAHEQAGAAIARRGEAEAALTMRDEFMSVAAHELRTPVTGIKISAQLALRTLEEASQVGAATSSATTLTPDAERIIHQYLLGIVGGANRLAVLMSDLMDVSRMRSDELVVHLAPIDLAALVRTVGLRYAGPEGDRHQVVLDVPTAPLMVAGDPGRLEQILDNLLSNAVKYSPDGGDIGVRLRPALDGVVLAVSDNGIGLPPGAEESIFEPFGRAANARQRGLPGMGLGLHICRQIAAAHGGRMWAESRGEGQGMTVSVWLPAA